MVPKTQHVHARHRVVDGVLVEDGPVAALYVAMAHPELPAELARVHSADDAVAFAGRYGLLGFREQILDMGDVMPAAQLTVARQFNRQRRKQGEGDPIEWVLAHAAAVRLVLALAHGLKLNDARQLSRTLAPYRAQHQGVAVITVREARPAEPVPSLIDFPINVDEAPALARRIVAELVNANLRARRRIARETLRPYFGLYALIDCVYWLLADEVSGGRLRQCPTCEGIFTATDDRMKYCPPARGLEGPSRCMNRAKVRRWREEKKKHQRGSRRSRRSHR